MRAFVDSGRCQGHTLCAMIAPDSFQLDDIEGSASPIGDAVLAGQEELVREAARSLSRESNKPRRLSSTQRVNSPGTQERH